MSWFERMEGGERVGENLYVFDLIRWMVRGRLHFRLYGCWCNS